MSNFLADEELPMPPLALMKQADKYKGIQSLHQTTLSNPTITNDSVISSIAKEGTSKDVI